MTGYQWGAIIVMSIVALLSLAKMMEYLTR
jgi:hypothetical protein